MNSTRFAGLLLLVSSTALGDAAPSRVMRQIPALPDVVTAESCAAADTLLASVEEQARADMLRTQQLSMRAMNAGGGAVSDRQGELIGKLMDPAITMCEMNAAQALAGPDASDALQTELQAIRSATQTEVHAKCPVIDMADYRDTACVEPIEQRGIAQERQALQRFVVAANAALAREVDAFAGCAEIRETMAADAQAANLPAQFLSIALGGRSQGWQSVGSLVERYQHYCGAAQREFDYLKARAAP